MSDHETHEQFDDELLSAYLDNELTPEERARVERRLAADPAARQLVEQLRAVSRSVQALPQESVGVDLRDAILERAQRTVRAATAASDDADLARSDLRLSVGRSKRGWVWAGLAVAAALLIMAFQPKSEQENGLPGAVAQRDKAERSGSGGNVEWRALPESVAPPTESAPELAAASSDERDLERLSDLNRETSAKPSAGFGAGGVGLGGALADASAAGDAAVDESFFGMPLSVDVQDQLLVVHVQLKPAAFRAKAFDGLLMRNGIALEKTPAEENRAAQPAESALTQEQARLEEHVAEPPQQWDVVLVDAPVPQIESCLVELDADKENYLAVAVEDETLAESKAVAAKQLSAAQSWQRFNRGNVAQQRKVPRQEDELTAESTRRAAPAPASPSSASDATSLQLLSRSGKAEQTAGRSSIQVLFVLSADPEPAPSLPADNRAE